jgi:hypothetical protein
LPGRIETKTICQRERTVPRGAGSQRKAFIEARRVCQQLAGRRTVSQRQVRDVRTNVALEIERASFRQLQSGDRGEHFRDRADAELGSLRVDTGSVIQPRLTVTPQQDHFAVMDDRDGRSRHMTLVHQLRYGRFDERWQALDLRARRFLRTCRDGDTAATHEQDADEGALPARAKQNRANPSHALHTDGQNDRLGQPGCGQQPGSADGEPHRDADETTDTSHAPLYFIATPYVMARDGPWKPPTQTRQVIPGHDQEYTHDDAKHPAEPRAPTEKTNQHDDVKGRQENGRRGPDVHGARHSIGTRATEARENPPNGDGGDRKQKRDKWRSDERAVDARARRHVWRKTRVRNYRCGGRDGEGKDRTTFDRHRFLRSGTVSSSSSMTS